MAHKGHAANKKETLQTKKKRCKQKGTLQIKKSTLQIKTSVANKRCLLQITEMLPTKTNVANKKGTLQIKRRKNHARALGQRDWAASEYFPPFPPFLTWKKYLFFFSKLWWWHDFTPSLLHFPFICKPGGSSHMKRHGLIVGKFEFNS